MRNEITVDMTPGLSQPILYYSQNDVGTELVIKLKGADIPAGATITLRATKPSGFGFIAENPTVSGNTVTFITTEDMTDEYGRFPAELNITSEGVSAGTANFIMAGEKNPHPEGTTDGQAEEVVPELTQLVERVEDAASSVLDRQTVTNTLPAGSQASYSFDEETNTQTFGIPQGEAGAGAVDVTASAYSSSKTYAVGDYVIHNDYLYRCTTAITTAEAWTSGHWTQVLLGNEVSDVKSDLAQVSGATVYESWFNKTINVTPAFESGYINADGSSAGGTTYSHTEKISVKEGDIVTYYYNDEATVVRSYVAYVNGTADSSKGTTSGSVSKFTVPSGVTEVVANAWADSSGGYFAIETTEKNYENAFDTKLEPLLDKEAVSVWQTVSGWKLLKNGLCVSDANYKLVKFKVTAGSLVKVTTNHMCQFQNSVSVPSSGSSNKVGGTYEDGEYVLEVPTGATYLIVSALATGSVASCSKILTDIFGEENDAWEV